MTSSSKEPDVTAQDRKAVIKKIEELLRSEDLESAHRELVRMIRTNSRDPEVNFLLALVRKRLSYDISAEALFQRAFDLGFVPPEDLEDEGENSKRKLWTDHSGEVSIVLRPRPRVKFFEFLGFASPEPA